MSPLLGFEVKTKQEIGEMTFNTHCKIYKITNLH
jgi:hypothetical protein